MKVGANMSKQIVKMGGGGVKPQPYVEGVSVMHQQCLQPLVQFHRLKLQSPIV